MLSHAPAIVVGMGELGAAFGRGLLKSGRPVFPVLRGMTLAHWLDRGVDPKLIVLAVGETALDGVLQQVPRSLGERLVLVQNELVPSAWTSHGFEPTVIVVWFEKKRGTPVKIVLPSVVAGPRAELVSGVLDVLEIPSRRVEAQALPFELVAKNLYILTTNIAGLETRSTVQDLWEHHRETALGVAAEVLSLQERLIGHGLDRERLLAEFARAVAADPEHACTGRSAPARLERALLHAGRLGVDTPVLRRIARDRVSP